MATAIARRDTHSMGSESVIAESNRLFISNTLAEIQRLKFLEMVVA